MGAAVAIRNAATKVGSIVSEHGDTISTVKDRAGRTVSTAELAHKAANANSFKASVDTTLDAASLVVAGTVGNIPLVGAAIQGGIGLAKVGNNLAHGDMAGAKTAAIEGTVTAGASLIPGGGLATKVAKGALVVGGEVGKYVVASNDEKFEPTAVAPVKTPGKPDPKVRHT